MATLPTIETDKRIPTLDGWRALAVFMVLLSHFQPGYRGHVIWGMQWLNLGQHGVQIFFVLSGYLITANLLREEKIKLGRFYVRRFFRLMPAAWSYLIFLGLLSVLTNIKAIGSDAWSCLFFFRNYVTETHANTCTEHFWSLSLEEQFYLAWPPILALLGRRRAAFTAALAAIGLAVYTRAVWSGSHDFFLFQHTEIRADGLLVGCVLAFVLQDQSVRQWLMRHGRTIFWVCLIPLGWDLYRYRIDGLMTLNESILIAIVIACTSLHPAALPGRLLELPFIRITGIMSYSIYLWQGLFFRASWGIFGPLLFAGAFLLSWRFIEQPGIRFGRKLLSRYSKRSVPPESAVVVAG
jgi:peptidoglycan/LPS O-acetylase OafA/YrhL